MMMSVSIASLHFGHEFPGADINARVQGRADEIEKLAALIKAEGLLQPLLVFPSPDGDAHYVIDGNRRLAALRLLAERGDGSDTVNVLMYDGDMSPAEALRKSFIANEHLPMHPVDRFTAFAGAQESGAGEEEIDAIYSVSARVVRQSLALGRLAPSIRDAWRKGEIDAEDAQCFTLEPDQDEQARVFAKLKKAHRLHSHDIRQAFVGDQRNVGKLLKFVGAKEYQNAGGGLRVDLFDDANTAVDDIKLLTRLAEEKIVQKCNQLLAAGWAWASDEGALPPNHWGWGRLTVSAKTATAEQKSQSGCAVRVDHNGKWDITYGVVKPGSKKAATKKKTDPAAADEAENAPTALSAALKQRLGEQLTRAAQTAIPADIDVALSALISGLCSYGSPVTIGSSGKTEIVGDEGFADVFARCLKNGREKNLQHLAHLVGSSLQLSSLISLNGEINEECAALCAAIPAPDMNAALEAAFDAKDFYDSIPKAVALRAIAETCGQAEADRFAAKRRGEIAEAARKLAFADRIAAQNPIWLPDELRTAHYTGPGAEKSRPAKKSRKEAHHD